MFPKHEGENCCFSLNFIDVCRLDFMGFKHEKNRKQNIATTIFILPAEVYRATQCSARLREISVSGDKQR
jgi:hypothetical protein